MARASSLLSIVICHLSLLSLVEQVTGFNPRCSPFPCGSLGNISFPFSSRTHPECGLIMVDDCDKSIGQKIRLGKDSPSFYISNIKQDHTLELHEPEGGFEHIKNHTCGSFKNFTFPSSPFYSFEISSNLTMLNCLPATDNLAECFKICKGYSHSVFSFNQPIDVLPSLAAHCSVIHPQVTQTQKRVLLSNIHTGGFFLQVNVTTECKDCYYSGGQCRSDSNGNFKCSGAKTGNAKGQILIIAVGAITMTGIGILIILALCFKKRLSSDNSTVFWKKKCKDYRNIEAFLRNYGSLAPKRYNYSDIKRMTNSFKHKLGEGGFGGVYKGKLLDGRNVAVKVLNGLKGNGEDFINEVASIGRTSHVNIVGLFGYCFESQGRALIYEFVPNGSLEKFIYEKYSTNKQLKWDKLYQIALSIARGLEYLHRGCSTRILHFDIKPHNILLDEDFCPKISDFGLAKICPRKESIVSMTGARGTVGYIAPELFCRHFGEVSHKSDVYSYGMMVLEMVGGRKNVDDGVCRTSEIYFPYWVYERLELDEELELQGIENEEDNECVRKMIIVSLWCIQTSPSSRPAMSRVVEMLEGSLDSFQFPPKPFISSPRSEAVDSVTSQIF
ncbi:hypothetical protein Ddye_030019 [Dipteronia dyeriana]|uniref:Protein kinase domain-containing protein n=1 Tax=Dipteronia dyeriana TaxID=168575 RepID=A0AAD9TFN6_9ROSI|nr:hypothetical protein Ddye_030019 [Dipteronia dyeriana]